jgi:hypothetical protein
VSTADGGYRRRNYPVENPAYHAMVRRMLRAMARRVATDGDIEGLADMVKMQDELGELIAETVRSLRDDHGYSWAEVGRETGMTRQSAHERWGRRAVSGTP